MNGGGGGRRRRSGRKTFKQNEISSLFENERTSHFSVRQLEYIVVVLNRQVQENPDKSKREGRTRPASLFPIPAELLQNGTK